MGNKDKTQDETAATSSEESHYTSMCQSIYRISDYTRSFIKDESPTRL